MGKPGMLLWHALAQRYHHVAPADLAKVAGKELIALYVLVTLVVVISVQSLGNILVLALLITPVASARSLSDRIVTMMVLAPIIGGLSAFIGSYCSCPLDLPAGGTIVLVATALFLITWVFDPKHGILISRPKAVALSA